MAAQVPMRAMIARRTNRSRISRGFSETGYWGLWAIRDSWRVQDFNIVEREVHAGTKRKESGQLQLSLIGELERLSYPNRRSTRPMEVMSPRLCHLSYSTSINIYPKFVCRIPTFFLEHKANDISEAHGKQCSSISPTAPGQLSSPPPPNVALAKEH